LPIASDPFSEPAIAALAAGPVRAVAGPAMDGTAALPPRSAPPNAASSPTRTPLSSVDFRGQGEAVWPTSTPMAAGARIPRVAPGMASPISGTWQAVQILRPDGPSASRHKAALLAGSNVPRSWSAMGRTPARRAQPRPPSRPRVLRCRLPRPPPTGIGPAVPTRRLPPAPCQSCFPRPRRPSGAMVVVLGPAERRQSCGTSDRPRPWRADFNPQARPRPSPAVLASTESRPRG